MTAGLRGQNGVVVDGAPPSEAKGRLLVDEPAEVARSGPRLIARPILRRISRDITGLIGLSLVTVFLLVAAFGPRLAPADPLEATTERLQAPSAAHWLGTDGLGRDLLSRLLHGARLTLGTALLAALLVTVIGLVVGTVAGYAGGIVDTALMRLVDVVLAIPALVLALAVAGLFRPSLLAVMLGLVTVWWAGYARVVRGLVLTIRERPFVEAARSVGARRGRVLVRHILPGVISPIIVIATLDVGQLVLVISGLSFLGLGSPPPTPEWGAMLNEGRVYFLSDPHVVLIPGVAISLAVLGFNLLGDGIRDALDPRLSHVEVRPRLLGRGQRRMQRGKGSSEGPGGEHPVRGRAGARCP